MSTKNSKFSYWFGRLGNNILETVFPAQCAGCGIIRNKTNNPDGFLCTACAGTLELNQWLFCPICNKKLVGCQPCKSHPGPLKAIGAAVAYENRLVKTLIWKYKYGFQYTLAEPLAKKLCQYAAQSLLPELDTPKKSLAIAYIPLYPKRYRWRGFNQAELLAKNLGELLDIPVIPALKRIRFIEPQMQINDKIKRFANIKDVFAADENSSLDKKTIILIDDIAASGATMIEAAKILKRAGAEKIYGLVIARSQ